MTLDIIEKILKTAGSSMKYVTHLKVFLVNNTKLRYSQMNQAYATFFKQRNLPVPSRITIGCSAVK